MAVTVGGVLKGSRCFKRGIRAGDSLLSVNGNEIMDILDYDFHIDCAEAVLAFKTARGRTKHIRIPSPQENGTGLTFDTYLMDKQRHCKNKCIFCFIDQLPKGMRESLYFKDDDSRLSFLFGNYITLTNLTEHEVERIIAMHISPVNISVHTMNPDLRVRMMNNPNAGKALSIVRRLAEAGIKINTQLVLCPGVNDGEELRFSLRALSELYPSVQSVAAVPVGLTRFREGLYHLTPYTKKTAGEAIDIIEAFSSDFKERHGIRLAYPADEFFLKAERELPDEDYYDGYPQIDNGVGLLTSLRNSFYESLSETELSEMPHKKISLATGRAAYPLLSELSAAITQKFPSVEIRTYCIENRFFGENITVAGLITGKDLTEQLKDKDLGEKLYIPSAMVRATYPEETNGVFLDDMTVQDAERELGVSIQPLTNDGGELLNTILEVD